MKKDYQAISESISDILGTRQSLSESLIDEGIKALSEKKKKRKGSTLNPFSSRLGSDVMVSPQEMDTPETGLGRLGLTAGRYYGGYQGGALGALGGAAAGGIAGAGAGALAGLGAKALGMSSAGAQNIAMGLTAGGLGAGLIKGATYGARKGAGLGGRAARYISTGSTKLPSERKKKKNG